MQTQSPDTSLEAEQVQIELIRNATVAQRIARAWSLSEMVIHLSRRAIQRRHPEWTDKEVNLAFIEYHYGRDLAASVSRYLESTEG